MEPSARLYNCVCCRQLVVLCSECDKGNIYCFDGCSEKQRTQSLREAGKRYQGTFKGKRNAARRQAEFRERTRKATAEPPSPENKVTLQGAEENTLPVLMDLDPREGEVGLMYCHCCGKPVDHFLRPGFIRHHTPLLSGSWPFKSGV
jgi:hypothetical protein